MQWISMIPVWTIFCLNLIQCHPVLHMPQISSETPVKWNKTQPQLVRPQLHLADSSFSNRSSSASPPSILVLRTRTDAIYMELRPNEDLIKSKLFDSGTNNGPGACHYHGIVLSPSRGTAAISICESRNKMRGTLFIDDDAYILRPLDEFDGANRIERIQDISTSSNGADLHVISKVDHPSKYCGLEHDGSESSSEEDEIDNLVRIRRAASDHRKVIETAVYVDHPLYRKFIVEGAHSEAELTDMVLAIINQVQIIYNYQSLKIKFKIVVVKLEFLKDDKDGPDPADGDVDKYLDNFCLWQSSRNPAASSDDHWDHAIMLSGYDLHKFTDGKKNKKVLGLAWINGMCRPKHSCTLNEGSSFEAAFVIAHEMGHSLGMLHDGRGNNCNPAGYLMAEKTGPGRVTWSSCSNEYLAKFLQKGRGRCLDDGNAGRGKQHFVFAQEKPGHLFDLNDQCRLSLGSGYRPHVMPKTPFNNVCRELWCVQGLWASIAHPALEGSSCGVQKECIQGKCQPKNSTESSSKMSAANTTATSTEKTVIIHNMLADFLENLRLTLGLILP